MTEPSPASKEGETAIEHGSDAQAESKDTVADNENDVKMKIDEQENNRVLIAGDKENQCTSENGTVIETSEELGVEKQAKDDPTAVAEDVNTLQTEDIKVNEDTVSVESDCNKTLDVDADAVKAKASDEGKAVDPPNAKEGNGEYLKAEDAQDMKAGTMKDGKDVNMEDLGKMVAYDFKDAKADDVEPKDSGDVEGGDAEGVKLINTEGVKEDVIKDENDSKIAEEDRGEEKTNINEEEGSGSMEKKVDQGRTEDSKKKRPRGQNAIPGGNKKVNKDDVEKDKGLQSTPVTSTNRPVRERKSVERLVEVISKEPNQEFNVEKGHGTPLKDIPNVVYKLARKKPADIKLIHQTLFGRKGKAVDFKNHILQFSGFVWHDSDEKQRAKIKEKLDKYVKDTLLDLCDLFDLSISRANSRKEDLVTKLLDFLIVPHVTTDVLLADRDQVASRKRKRVAKGDAYKSSAGLPAQGSKKKRTKVEDAPTRKGKTVGESDNEDDKDDNSIGSSYEEKSAEHSVSEVQKSESKESEKEDTDGERSAKGKTGKKNVSKETGSVVKEKSKVRWSPKKSLMSSSKSPKASSVKISEAKDDEVAGSKVFLRKTKNVGSHKKKLEKESESEESEKEDTHGEKSAKGKFGRKNVSKETGSIGKEKSEVALSPKKDLMSSSKSPKASSVTSFKAKDDEDAGTKVFSRKTINVGSPKKKSEVKEWESEEPKKEVTDGEKSAKGNTGKKEVSKETGSMGKEKSKVGPSPKKSLMNSSKSRKASSVKSSKAKDDVDAGTKVFSRKTKSVGSPKKSDPKSDSKEKESGKKVGKG